MPPPWLHPCAQHNTHFTLRALFPPTFIEPVGYSVEHHSGLPIAGDPVHPLRCRRRLVVDVVLVDHDERVALAVGDVVGGHPGGVGEGGVAALLRGRRQELRESVATGRRVLLKRECMNGWLMRKRGYLSCASDHGCTRLTSRESNLTWF